MENKKIIKKSGKVKCTLTLTPGSDEKIAKWAVELYKAVSKKNKNL